MHHMNRQVVEDQLAVVARVSSPSYHIQSDLGHRRSDSIMINGSGDGYTL